MTTLTDKTLTIAGTVTELDPTPTRYTYQRVAPGRGNLPGNGSFDLQRRLTVTPADPKTPAQLARRAAFASAVAQWHTLDPLEKQEWRTIGAASGITGFNAFISHAIG